MAYSSVPLSLEPYMYWVVSKKNILLKSSYQPLSTTGRCVTIMVRLNCMRRTTSNALNVLPKRILAFQSIWLDFLNFLQVLSMASCCSGRKMIGDCSMVISVGRSEVRFSLAACIARLAVCKSHSNHSTPMPSPKSWRLMPERRRMLWIPLSLRKTYSFPYSEIDNSVCSKSN